MNTKTSLKRVYNYYNGTEHGVGRDSPGALLDMLAEVASQTLHSEKKWTESLNSDGVQMKSQSKLDTVIKRKSSNNQEASFNSSQLLSMPATQLVKQFSIFTGDELKRQYSYTCALVPGCSQKYTSFASEGRARMSIKAHLADHLDCLKKDKDAYSSFTAIAAKHKNSKTNPGCKKAKVIQQKKPIENLNKENKDAKSGKSTNYLRKILSNEMNFNDFEKQKNLDKIDKRNDNLDNVEIKKDPDGYIPQQHSESQVLGDHSYHGQAIDDNNDNHEANTDLRDIMVNETMGGNIMLMVVESDGVHMKEVPYIASDISVSTKQNGTETIYLPEPVNWSEEVYTKNMEISIPAKPKGKAKFIGTSKEEKEMALALMERIKRKGNPGGGNLQCRICDPPRSFTAPTTLVSHYRSHAGIKPYECRICRAVFTRRHSLKYHMLIHQNQTRFTCADCGKKFRHPSHFREHRRRHTGEAPFGCEDCGQRFKTRNTYKRHLKTRHGKVLTTTGELLHLSEEDFQKVRTNPKRRAEMNYSESMIDEDITAPEVIIQLQNQESSNDVNEDNQVKEEQGDGEENYQGLIEGDELWENENREDGQEVEEEDEGGQGEGGEESCYRDYEYFEESQVNKTDYIKTDINIENSEFENVVNDDYKEDKDDEIVENNSIAFEDKNNTRGIQLLENGESNYNEVYHNQGEILYDENLSIDKKSNFIQYVEGIDVTDCVEDVIPYDDSVRVLREEEVVVEHDYHFENNVEEDTEDIEVDYFHNNLNTDNEIEYKHVEFNMERYKEMNVIQENDEEEESLQSTIQDPLASQQSMQCEEQNEGASNINTEILEQVEVDDSAQESINEDGYSLDGSEVALEGDFNRISERKYPERFLLQEGEKEEEVCNDDSKSIRANVAVERIVEYPTTNYDEESEENETLHNKRKIYLQTDHRHLSSNNIIIKNQDFVNLLNQRIKIRQNRNKFGGLLLPKSSNGSNSSSGKVVTLLNAQPQSSFNMIQNGKQGTILLLQTNHDDLKNNYLKIETNNSGVINNGIQTLPVIAVKQK